jgi:hypothetical protein
LSSVQQVRIIYWTLAFTVAAPFRVNVHLAVLFPPLEHAPDQIAERPLVTDKVTDVPVVNEADPLLPVATLMPAGLEVTRSPLRPLALTVSAAVWGGGGGGGDDADVTVRIAVFVTAFNVAEIVTPVDVVTPVVVMLNTAVCEPAGIVTLAGTAATFVLLLDSATVVGVVAAAERASTPCALVPPETLVGLSVRFDSVLVDEPAGFTVMLPVRVVPL